MFCSFCNKPSTEVAYLIASETANICDRCVAECVEVINNSERNKVDPICAWQELVNE